MKFFFATLLVFMHAAHAQPTRWQPDRIDSFDIQLNTPAGIADIPPVDVVELDHDSAPQLLRALQARGTRMICYFNAGAWESYRRDQEQFPPTVLGKRYEGFPQERWLDIRNIAALAPIMRARMDQCKEQGFAAVDPDNVNGYQNDTGFDLSAADQLAYNRWLMKEAHARGLAIVLKNTPELAKTLEKDGYDLAVTESCFADAFCDDFQPFLKARKPVLDLEYEDEGMEPEEFCAEAQAMGITALLKQSSSSIGVKRYACNAPTARKSAGRP